MKWLWEQKETKIMAVILLSLWVLANIAHWLKII